MEQLTRFEFIIAPANPLDIAPDELNSLALELESLGGDVRVVSEEERGAGVTFWEVIYIWLPSQDFVEGVLYSQLVRVVGTWIRDRFKKSGSEQRPKSVIIFGPDGRPLRKVELERPDAELSDEEPGDSLPHLPPE